MLFLSSIHCWYVALLVRSWWIKHGVPDVQGSHVGFEIFSWDLCAICDVDKEQWWTRTCYNLFLGDSIHEPRVHVFYKWNGSWRLSPPAIVDKWWLLSDLIWLLECAFNQKIRFTKFLVALFIREWGRGICPHSWSLAANCGLFIQKKVCIEILDLELVRVICS